MDMVGKVGVGRRCQILLYYILTLLYIKSDFLGDVPLLLQKNINIFNHTRYYTFYQPVVDRLNCVPKFSITLILLPNFPSPSFSRPLLRRPLFRRPLFHRPLFYRPVFRRPVFLHSRNRACVYFGQVRLAIYENNSAQKFGVGGPESRFQETSKCRQRR